MNATPTLILRGTHKDGAPFEAHLVSGEPTNLRDHDNSVVVKVIHGGKVYHRRWSSCMWARAKLAQRCRSLFDWHTPEYVR